MKVKPKIKYYYLRTYILAKVPTKQDLIVVPPSFSGFAVKS